jgi:uncharacterized membrane protein YfcA
VFAIAGVVGASVGSTVGKLFDGQRLLPLFSILMLFVGALMLRRRSIAGDAEVALNRETAGKLVLTGVGAGALSGFFGIGGGFLGARLARRLSARRGSLNVVLAIMIIVVGVYTLYRSMGSVAAM